MNFHLFAKFYIKLIQLSNIIRLPPIFKPKFIRKSSNHYKAIEITSIIEYTLTVDIYRIGGYIIGRKKTHEQNAGRIKPENIFSFYAG